MERIYTGESESKIECAIIRRLTVGYTSEKNSLAINAELIHI